MMSVPKIKKKATLMFTGHHLACLVSKSATTLYGINLAIRQQKTYHCTLPLLQT